MIAKEAKQYIDKEVSFSTKDEHGSPIERRALLKWVNPSKVNSEFDTIGLGLHKGTVIALCSDIKAL